MWPVLTPQPSALGTDLSDRVLLCMRMHRWWGSGQVWGSPKVHMSRRKDEARGTESQAQNLLYRGAEVRSPVTWTLDTPSLQHPLGLWPWPLVPLRFLGARLRHPALFNSLPLPS